MAECSGEQIEKDLFFHVEGIKYQDLVEMFSASDKREKGLPIIKRGSSSHMPTGKTAIINNKKIALFKYKGKVYAMDEQCPHMGGPLHLGDIEEFGEARMPCIVCPWHNWKYYLCTGEMVTPYKNNVKVSIYPVDVRDNGCLYVAFESLSSDYFNCGEEF